MIADTNANANGKVRRSGTLTAVDSRSTNSDLNPLGQTWSAGDLLFATTGGGLTNVRPTSGRSVKAAYTLEGSSIGDVLLAYPMENPVWITAASGENVVLRVGDSAGTNKVSIRNYTNAEVAWILSNGTSSFTGSNYNASYVTTDNTSYVLTNNDSYILGTNTSYMLVGGSRAMTGNLSMGSKYINNLISGAFESDAVNKSYVDSVASTYNAIYDAKIGNPIFGYVSLMAGSAMDTTTNPTVMNQWETSSNKNNYISINFTDTGSEVAQWIVDFPADWNSSENVIFTPVWTAAEGSGTVNFTVKAKLFPDDAVLDTALATVGTSVDTLIATGDIHVSPATTGAVITSVGSGGNTAIIQVSRDSSQDTLSGTAQLIALRVKYSRILA